MYDVVNPVRHSRKHKRVVSVREEGQLVRVRLQSKKQKVFHVDQSSDYRVEIVL